MVLWVAGVAGMGVRKLKLRYPEHMGQEELMRGLKRGLLFRASIRVNASDRSQAFATLPGLPSDVMIRV
jgi:DIS3-like exonuclease 2